MSICVISQQQGYDIRSGSFREGWDGRLHEIRNQGRQKETICTRCQLRSVCGMCPANGELENGDPESPVDFLCQVAHLRAYALGMDVPEHGDCGCCKPGKLHSGLTESAKRIQDLETDQEMDAAVCAQRQKPLPALNVLQTAGNGGGCGSCGAHQR